MIIVVILSNVKFIKIIIIIFITIFAVVVIFFFGGVYNVINLSKNQAFEQRNDK